MSHVTWQDVFAAASETISELKASRRTGTDIDKERRIVDSVTKKHLGLNAREADAFGTGMASNAEWFLHAIRTSGLGVVCRNEKVRRAFNDLFVIDPVIDTFFLTTEKIITAKSSSQGGLNWKRTPQVTRKRANKVMNWGTMHTVFAPVASGARVVLIPNKSIEDDVVFVTGPVLVRYLKKFNELWSHNGRFLDKFDYLGMWPEFYAQAMSAVTMKTEHECISYHANGAVPCSVYRIDSNDLYDAKYKPAHVKRIAVSATKSAHATGSGNGIPAAHAEILHRFLFRKEGNSL